MQQFTLTEKKTVLMPNSASFRPLKEADGTPITGDNLIRRFGHIIREFESKGRPVPIPEQSFIGWIKQANKMLDEGKTSEEIFASTIV